MCKHVGIDDKPKKNRVIKGDRRFNAVLHGEMSHEANVLLS